MDSSGQRFTARVHVFPRAEILDPQGKAIGDALGRLEFSGVSDVRAGKCFTMSVEAASQDQAQASLTKMCEKLLANTVTEDYSIEVVPEADPAGAAQ